MKNILRSLFWIGLSFACALPAEAQKTIPAPYPGSDVPAYLDRQKNIGLSDGSNEDVENALLNQLYHQHEKVTLRLRQRVRSLTADWLHYTVYFEGQPIFPHYLKVRLPFGEKIGKTYYAQHHLQAIAGSTLPDTLVIKSQKQQQGETILSLQSCWWNGAEGLQAAVQVTLRQLDKRWQEYYGAGGQLLHRQDLNRYHRASLQKDTSLTVDVFNPDPLTTAQKTYGGAYVDNQDRFVPELDQEIETHSVKGTFENGTYLLKNDYLEMVDVSPPSLTIPVGSNNRFQYGREEDQFEAVNAFFHITTFKEYLNRLGFTQIPAQPLRVDANALNGGDASLYSTFENWILLGEGGVDDAEDADVIVHEYAHAAIWTAAPDLTPQLERSSLEEAVCDYIAGSYSMAISTFGKDRIYSWDGHNEFWQGRLLSSTKDYQQITFGSNIYQHTDLLSSILVDIRDQLGRDATDELVLEATFGLLPSSTFDQYACHMLLADSILNQEANSSVIRSAFKKRNVDACANGLYLEERHLTKQPLMLQSGPNFLAGPALLEAVGAKQITARLYNSSGQEMASWTQNGARLQLAPRSLPSGLYLLETSSNDGRRRVFKLSRF